MSNHCNKCGDSIHAWGFLQRNINAELVVTNMVPFQVYAIKRRLKHITRTVTETPKHINFMQVECMCRTVPITVIQKIPVLMCHFVCSCRCKAINVEGKQIPNTVHLIMNLAYQLKPHLHQKYVPFEHD